jgi:cytochrome c peroxidase
MKIKTVLFFCFCFVLFAFQLANEKPFIVPNGWPKPVYDFSKNPLNKNTIELGRALFYEPQLSRNNIVSCASCHSQYTAFTHVDHALSHGIEDKIGTRNSPALMNLAWQQLFMWDGAVNHLDVQALAPIANPVEMDENISNVAKKLQHSKYYPKLFYEAFGDSIITGEHTLKALSQFMLTLVSHNSKYDSVMRKEAEFTAQEKNGYLLFKKNCSSCHTEPLFTNNEFKSNGLPFDTTLNDYGRFGITKDTKDSLKFKVPSLRNIEFSYPYMHDGRFKKLSEVLKHYTSGVIHNASLSTELQHQITLNANERVDIVAFLLTLTDRSFLFNPNFSYPKNLFLDPTKD